MQDRPTLSELTLAVREFLETEIVPTLNDPRLKFRTLVAMNALSMIARESELEEPQLREECSSLIGLLGDLIDVPKEFWAVKMVVQEANTRLAGRIRMGEIPAGTLEHLLRTQRAKLEVASPAYLRRYASQPGDDPSS
jgi:Domain of unknown function (DUF6285)